MTTTQHKLLEAHDAMMIKADCMKTVLQENQKSLFKLVLQMYRHEEGSLQTIKRIKRIAENLTTDIRMPAENQDLLERVLQFQNAGDREVIAKEKADKRAPVNDQEERRKRRDKALKLPDFPKALAIGD